MQHLFVHSSDMIQVLNTCACALTPVSSRQDTSRCNICACIAGNDLNTGLMCVGHKEVQKVLHAMVA